MTSEQERQILGQAQMYQQQLQGLMAQKENLKMQSSELKKAKEELEKTEETEVYKLSGPLLIKSKKADVQKEIKEKLELIETQIKTVEKGEKAAKSKLEDLRAKLDSGQKAAAG